MRPKALAPNDHHALFVVRNLVLILGLQTSGSKQLSRQNRLAVHCEVCHKYCVVIVTIGTR